jgi:hypothetical protein
MAKPWERRPDESEAAFLAFDVWNSHPVSIPVSSRLAEIVSEKIGYTPTLSTLETWMKRYDWHDRRIASQNCHQNEKYRKAIASVAKERTLILKQHTRVRRLAMRKTVSTIAKLKDTVPADAKECNVILDGVLKAMQAVGIGSLDHADQLRKLSAEVGSGVVEQSSETEEVIPPIPPEPGCVQQSDPSEEGLLGTPAGDLPGDSGSVHPDGYGDHG